MSSIPQPMPEKPVVTAERTSSVIMGRQDFVSVLIRSITGELYKIQHRLMSKLLLIIAAALIVIIFAFVLLAALVTSNLTGETCSGSGRTQTCTSTQPSTAQQLQQKTQASVSLRLPTSLTTSGSIIVQFVGLVVLTILAGTIVGGEYGIGTVRLMLTRGPTRTQYLLAKALALLVCTFITFVLLALIGIIVGGLFNLIVGVSMDWGFLTGDWLLHAVLYILIATLGLFTYSMIALNLATLGKATAAGVAGALVWWVLESILGSLLPVLGLLNNGVIGNFLRAIPDYFIGNNISALLSHQSAYLNQGQLATGPQSITDLHAIIVLAVYLLIFIGLAWLVQQTRDITN